MQLLKIYYVIQEERHNFKDDSDIEVSWEWDDHFYRSYLLNRLMDHLAVVYSNKPSVKDIWNTLEDQYTKEKKLSKSHLINKLFDFKFDDDTEVLSQVKELKNL